jgi:small GTP-binding protein
MYNINLIAEKNNYTVTLLSETLLENEKKTYKLLIRENNKQDYVEIKLSILGNVDSGKSTFTSFLTTNKIDDGRGLARSSIFNFIHELKTGRTSSISHNIFGFDSVGKIVHNQSSQKLSWPEIVSRSSKIINIIDLAGHEKYLRTSIFGLTSMNPDIAFILISANNGIQKMTKEHIFLCMTLNIPFVIIVSKVDICEERKNILKETMENTIRFVNTKIKRKSLVIKNNDDIIFSIDNIYSENIVPIFQTSCVTGYGMDNIKFFLNILSPKKKEYTDNDVEFHVDNIFHVYNYGLVLGGNLVKGILKVGQKLLLGPNGGQYQTITIKSLQCKKIPLNEVDKPSYVCIGIKKKIIVKRGNVILSNLKDCVLVKKFTAEINIIKTHSTTIKVGYEPILHAYSIRETVKIIDIQEKKNMRNIKMSDTNILRNGDSAFVTFEFKYNEHFLKTNTKILLCEGLTKIVGNVVSI